MADNLQGVQEDEIELDIDELSNDVLYKLLGFVRKYAPRPDDSPPRQTAASSSAAPARPKKNKPMSKHEQEANIELFRGKLSAFQNPGSDESPEPCKCDKQWIVRHSIANQDTDPKEQPADETSGDEDDSEESEAD